MSSKGGHLHMVSKQGKHLDGERLQKIGCRSLQMLLMPRRRERRSFSPQLQVLKEVLGLCFKQTGVGWPTAVQIERLVSVMPRNSYKSTFAAIWVVIPSTVVWEIRKERNRQTFQDKQEDWNRFSQRLERAISELVSNAASLVNVAKVPFTIGTH